MKTALMEYQWLCLLRISEPLSRIKSTIIDVYIKEKEEKLENPDEKSNDGNYDNLSEILEILLTKENIKNLIAFTTNKGKAS